MTEPEGVTRYKRKPLSPEQLKRLEAFVDVPDEEIDFSDAPEVTDADLIYSVRGPLFRPIKRQTTLRLDADLIEWFKTHGGTGVRGYQTRINDALRQYVSDEMAKSTKDAAE